MANNFGLSRFPRLVVEVNLNADPPANSAFYYDHKVYLGRGDGVVWKDIPLDPTIVVHEAMHALVDEYASLPSGGQGGSINESYADYFAASFLNEPRMGVHSYLRRPYKRTLVNRLRAFEDFKGKKYHDSKVISGTMWQIRSELGQKVADQFAWRSLTRTVADTKFVELKSIFIEVKDTFPIDQRLGIERILRERLWY